MGQNESKSEPPEAEWLTVTQAARMLNCSPLLVVSLIESGRIQAFDLGTNRQRDYRIKREDVERGRFFCPVCGRSEFDVHPHCARCRRTRHHPTRASALTVEGNEAWEIMRRLLGDATRFDAVTRTFIVPEAEVFRICRGRDRRKD